LPARFRCTLPARLVTAVHIARRFRYAFVLIALFAAAAAALPAAATAAKDRSCAEQVVDDWYDNGRVDFLYPLKCYRQAIKILPPDVKDYSTAKEVIERALADATNRPRVSKRTPLEDVPCKPGKRCIDPPGPGSNTGGPGGGGPSDPSGGGSAQSDTDTSGPSSVPIPLIVLGGLALLLLAAGSAGYLARRFGHHGEDDGGEPPPAV
jgi:hypothetical protein